MSTTTEITSTLLSISTSANSYCSYIGTGNISLSSWGQTTPYITNPYTTQNIGSWSSYFSTKPTDKLPELIPVILAYRGKQDEIKNVDKINLIYSSICSGITIGTSTEKNIEKYKALWEISKGNETIWIMYSKHDDKDVSQIANFLILHCH